jgi:carbonic anhydrase/acetyltransferase-like protein (isoleucine patch superfamily)
LRERRQFPILLPTLASDLASVLARAILRVDVRGGLRRNRNETGMIYELDGIHPELPEKGRYWIAPTATLIGKVRLRPDASVWFGAVLRGDNEWIELGTCSQIQDNATLHTDPGFPMTIGPDCVIGHNVVLHGCTIGANSLIGMGAIVLNGARIGDNCLVGAGALITEGKMFPDKSLIVGAPARAVRVLDDAAIKGIAAGADIYVRRFKQYAKGLKPVG